MSKMELQSFNEVEKYIYGSGSARWLVRYDCSRKRILYLYCNIDGTSRDGEEWGTWEKDVTDSFLRVMNDLIKSENPNYVEREVLPPVIRKLRELEHKFNMYRANKETYNLGA